MSIEKRIEELEKRTGVSKREFVIVVAYTEEVDGHQQGHPRDYTQEEYDRALEAYIKKHGKEEILQFSSGRMVNSKSGCSSIQRKQLARPI